MNIEGVGPSVETVVNARGGKQSSNPYRCDLFPAAAYLHLARILAVGAEKYGEFNWHEVTFSEHINHALTHIKAYGAGDRQDDHIGHAACRMVMALEVLIRENQENERPKMGFNI